MNERIEDAGAGYEVVIDAAQNKVLSVNPDMVVMKIDADWLTCDCELILHHHGARKMPEERGWWMSLSQADKERMAEALRTMGVGLRDTRKVVSAREEGSNVYW